MLNCSAEFPAYRRIETMCSKLYAELDLANYSIMTVLEIDDAQHEQEIAEQKTCDEGASDAD